VVKVGEIQLLSSRVMFSARIPKEIHKEFKKLCIDLDLEMAKVVEAMMKLFVEDPEFRSRVLKEIRGGNE
jgi:hypothetical protein